MSAPAPTRPPSPRSQAAAERRYRVAALVAALGIAAAISLTFFKGAIFGGGHEVRAVFASAAQLKGGSEVRMAGLRVGEVRSIEAGPEGTALVTLGLSEEALPLRRDARLALKPRLALEGNAYIDLDPGSPMEPELADGEIVPLERTRVAVQLDQVLDVFDRSTRDAMHSMVEELGEGLGGEGESAGYRGLRRAVAELADGLPAIGRVARSMRGTERGDLGRALRSSAETTAQLARDPQALASLVTSFNRTMSALAADDRALAATVRGFADVVSAAPPTLTALDEALPVLADFGDGLRPTLRRAPSTLRKTNRLLAQIEGSVGPKELPRLLDALGPALGELPLLEQRLATLLGWSRLVTDCISSNIVPTLNMKIPEDHIHATGDPVWLDLMHAFTGLTSFASAVDGNGGTVRTGIATGDQNLNGFIPGVGQVASSDPGIVGVRPTWLGYGVEPQYRPDAPCAEQELPDLSKRSGPPPAWPLKPVGDGGE